MTPSRQSILGASPKLDPFPVMAPPMAPLQGTNFVPSQGGAWSEGNPNKPGLMSALTGTGVDMLLGNKPGPSDRMIYNMGGGEGDAFSSLTGQLTPQMLQQLDALRLGRLNAGQTANTFNTNLGGL